MKRDHLWTDYRARAWRDYRERARLEGARLNTHDFENSPEFRTWRLRYRDRVNSVWGAKTSSALQES